MGVDRRSFVQGGAALGATAISGCASSAGGSGAASFSDPDYNQPFIDIDEWRDAPVRHRYVHGGFTGTDGKFSMYFPPAEHYQGRFFQPVMHISGNENAAAGQLAGLDSATVPFAFASGGYCIESNMGSLSIAGPWDAVHRCSAATATYSRQLAQEMYGGGRPFGYIYGGSGGGYKTIRCLEETNGVWDGGVPFIHGSPMSIPHVFTVQANALRVLEGKFEGIVDALDAGGSGDMYAGLNEEQRAALLEVTKFGFPPKAWFAHERLAFNYTGVFSSLYGQILRDDPQYFTDFWTVPGYLGVDPPPSLLAARVQSPATITAIITTAEARAMNLPVGLQAGTRAEAPAGVRLSALPAGGRMQGADLVLQSGASQGRRLMVVGVIGDIVMIGGDVPTLLTVRTGDDVQIDNSNYLALQSFHRHHVPSADYKVWDQYRNADGTPKYPQRPLNISNNANQDGHFNGKMIVMECLMDEAAYPWQADWYRKKIEAVLGEETDDRYRVYMVDRAMHVNPSRYLMPTEGQRIDTAENGPTDTQIVSYAGVLQQALRDVAAWAERGVAPPPSSVYLVDDGQVSVPAAASERKGLQPVVTLRANGGERVEIRRGQSVTLDAIAETPPNTGSIVRAEWDFDGQGHYRERSSFDPAPSVTLRTTHTFDNPGTYFPVLRVAAQRDGDAETTFTLARNLARVRVIVN